MIIDFNSIKDELLLKENYNTLMASLEFFNSLEHPKEIKNLRTTKIVKKLNNNNLSFDLNEVGIIIESLKYFESYILDKIKITPDDVDFKNKSKSYLPLIKVLLELITFQLKENGYAYRAK